jgi:predicted RNase H-like HicB family nuclease
MVKHEFTIVIEQDEEGWLVSEVVELPGCHTQAKTFDELISRTKEAIQAYLGEEKKLEISTKFIGVQKLEVVA